MNVINLIAATKTNPKLLKDLEKQILEIIKTDDYTSLKQMLETRNLECMFYAAIILEKRIKLIVKERHRIELFTAFLNYTINEYVKDSSINMFVNKIGDVHALAGIYFYPFFLDIYTIFSLPNLGALFYKKFLFACNTNNEITNDRRIEIRNVTKERNIQMLQCLQCDRLNAIEIYEYALLCIKDGDSLINAVLQIGGEDDETVSFFDTYLNMRNGNQADKIVEFMKTKSLDFLDRMIEIFMGVRKDVLTNINLLVHVCRSFNGSMLHLDYLTLVFKSIKHNDAYEEIALEVMRHMIAMNESDKETKVFELIRIINMHYPKVGAFVIEKYGTSIDAKIVLIMLRSYPKLQLLRFNNLLIECYRLLFIESRDCIKLMGGLDLKDAESCKFVAKATKKFNLDRDTIFVIMNNCKNINSEPSDELFVNCLLELEKYQLQQRDSYVAEFLAGDYTLRKRQRLCILLKKDFELGKGYVPSYFEYYLSTNDVETGFAILGTILKKTDLPQQIYAHLFTNMKSYTLQQMSSFITELLTSMDDQKSVLFFDPIYQKFCVDFETANYIDISLCIKAFGSFLEKKIIAQKNSTFIDTNTETTSIYLNMLINLLNLRDDQAIRKVYEVIKNNKLIVAIDLNYLADIYNTNPNSEILSLMVYILENSENEIKQSFKGGLKNKKDVIKHYLKQDTKVRFIVDKYGVKCDSDPGVDVSKFFE